MNEITSIEPAMRPERDIVDLVISRAVNLANQFAPTGMLVERFLVYAVAQSVSDVGKDGAKDILKSISQDIDAGAFDGVLDAGNARTH